jgi:glycosyltransferase involved in cell wall biosynthesis
MRRQRISPKLKFSVCIPTYNGARVIGETLRSILSQSFKNYEIIVVDDQSKDNTENVIKGFKDKRIKFFKNKINLGYSKNLEECRKKASGDILYLMGQDDILGEDALLNTAKAFMLSLDIGAVTRPYYWFDEEITRPVRAKEQMNPNKDVIVKITDSPQKVIEAFKTLDQLSGLAYRREYMDLPFHPDIFPCHIYPFASIFKKHPIVFLKDYNIAVRISSSQTRSVSSIYNKSPMKSWKEMFDTVFYEKKFQKLKNYCIKNFVAINYVGLVQLRNYARFRYFLREVYLLLAYRWENILSFGFWFYFLGCLITPPSVLIPLVDWYKNNIMSNSLRKIRFRYLLSEK